MRSRDTVYYIALALWYKHGSKTISDSQIETEIRAIAGEDARTFSKYKDLLVECGYIVLGQKGYELPHEPSKPLSPKNYVESLKGVKP